MDASAPDRLQALDVPAEPRKGGWMATALPPLLTIAPLYRNAGLLAGLAQSLISCGGDPERRICVLFINDSPDDAELAATLDRELPALRGHYDVELRTNEKN